MTPVRSFLSKLLQCLLSFPIKSLHLLEWLKFSQPSTLMSTEVNLELSYLVDPRNFNILFCSLEFLVYILVSHQILYLKCVHL